MTYVAVVLVVGYWWPAMSGPYNICELAAIASVFVFSFVHVFEPYLRITLIVFALWLLPRRAFQSVRKAISWRGVYTNAAMVGVMITACGLEGFVV
nr:hypothetical protein [Tanacetum cinerariifolium]